MSLNNKLDLRLEAAKIVAQLPETTIDNFHERAYRVELYLKGDAELPEQDSTLQELKQTIQEVKDLMQKRTERPSTAETLALIPWFCLGLAGEGTLKEILDKYSDGAPPPGEDPLFLQKDGEKVE